MQDLGRVSSQRLGLWCNWIFVALTAVGWLGIAHFYLPAPANLGADATKVWFSQTHHWGVLIGCSIFYIAAGLLTPGSIAFAMMLAKIEGRWPLWSIVMGVCGVFISLIIFFNSCAWIVAAYRPETSADVIQSWYDWAWFAFLLGWIYLTIEMFATAAVELMDQRPEPMVPRWFTWFTIAGGVTIFFAAGPAFFKSGPFAYHGLLAFYLPVVIWGTYLALTTWFMMQELRRTPVRPQTPATASVGAPS
jgi:MFS family permease